MKKTFISIVVLMMLLTVSMAVTVTLIEPQGNVSMESSVGENITLLDINGGIRWWKVLTGGIDVINSKFSVPNQNVQLQPMYEGNQIVVRQTSNGTITPGTTETTEGSNYAFTITPNSGYKIATLTVDGVSETVTNETGMTYTFTNVQENHVITATYEVGTAAPNGANAPVLAAGLTPVNWNGTAWETTTESSWDYNYNSVAEATHSTVAGNGDGKWANAQTADGSLYVWIPRYTYKITSGEHSSGNSWNSLDNPGTAKIEIKFSNGTIDDTSNSYIKHPAFTFGTDELQGIWVAKYEASQGNTTSELSAPTSSNSVAKSIPGVTSWRSISVSNMFDYAYNTYRNADSHLMKNVEWGAVAYLTNAIGRIPYINNSSDYITGNAGGSQDAAEASGTTNAWNTANGVKASTTHNVYGIYDMSGGAWEYVAAYYTGGSSSYISSLTSAADKYVDRYSTAYSASKKGDAVYETSSSSSSTNSWDGDYSSAPSSSSPVFIRGGRYDYDSYAGVFYFGNLNGVSSSNGGFRVVLIGVEPVAPTTYTITYNLDGGTVATANPTSYTSEDTITLNNPTKDGYNFTGWTGTGLAEATTTVTIPTGSTGDRTYTANWEVAVTPANAPVLATGLTPVNWNGSAWETTTVANWDYNYNSVAEATHSTVAGNGDGKWANAQTADGSLYVWIPRYSYKITSGEHQSGNSWNADLDPGTNKIEVKFSNGTTDDTSNSYIAHPAFTFGTDELKGIWVAKYEASQGTTTNQVSVPTSSSAVAKSLPAVTSWVNISASKMFDYAYNTYRTADSHLMKNIEWGAVTYLMGAIGRVPYKNNYYVNGIMKTGYSGVVQNAEEATVISNVYLWNTVNGVKASTTHNVYGIYDMAGGVNETVSAYVNNGNSNLNDYASSLVNAYNQTNLKYVDVYPFSDTGSGSDNYIAWSSIKGDAVYEISNSWNGEAWNGNAIKVPGNQASYIKIGPIFMRGLSTASTKSGIFSFYDSYGSGNVGTGFRVVLGIR